MQGTKIAKSPEFNSFKGSVPKQRVEIGGQYWSYFRMGPENLPPLLLLHGTSTTAECFFNQVLGLSSKGYHVIACQFPPYMTVADWIKGFDGFISFITNDACKVHIFGHSIGGYLTLHFIARHPSKVASVVLCNAFCDTAPFHQSETWLKMCKYLPEFMLKKYILDSFPEHSTEVDAIDFVVEQLEGLSKADVVSRLTLNCLKCDLPDPLADFDCENNITMLDSHDKIALPDAMRQRLYQRFPNARQALLKQGGDFPFLSVPSEVNMLLQVHMRSHGIHPQLQVDESESAATTAASNSADPHAPLFLSLGDQSAQYNDYAAAAASSESRVGARMSKYTDAIDL